MLIYQKIKNYYKFLLLVIKNIVLFKMRPWYLHAMPKNSLLMVSKEDYKILIEKIKSEKLETKIKLITFFDDPEVEPFVMAYKELWTDEGIDNKIHNKVQKQILVAPRTCEYLYWYEKSSRNIKIKFLKMLSRHYRCIFCFTLCQLPEVQSIAAVFAETRPTAKIMLRHRLYSIFF